MSTPLLAFPERHSRLASPSNPTQLFLGLSLMQPKPTNTVSRAEPAIPLLPYPGVNTGKKEIPGCLSPCPGHKGQERLCSLACWGPGQECSPGHLPAPDNLALLEHVTLSNVDFQEGSGLQTAAVRGPVLELTADPPRSLLWLSLPSVPSLPPVTCFPSLP